MLIAAEVSAQAIVVLVQTVTIILYSCVQAAIEDDRSNMTSMADEMPEIRL